MTKTENAIELAKCVAEHIHSRHGADVADKMMFLYVMQYPQWQYIVEDLGLAKARLALVSGEGGRR